MSPPRDSMLGFLSGYWYSQTLFVAAELRIADLVADGPKTSLDLARAAGAHEPSLGRLLRALASAGVFRETEPGTFAQNPLSEELRDVAGSLRPIAILGGHALHWGAWGALLHGVRTGETPFERAHGAALFDRADAVPYEAAWNACGDMDAAVAEALDITAARTVIDVGGGRGGLLRRILERNPQARGVLFDRPAVVAEAPPLERVDTAGGDFFESVPDGGDLYVLKFVLHDWPDDRAARILSNCARAMRDGARLAIAELIVPDDARPSPAKIDDLNMLVLTGGRGRTEAEFRELLADASLAPGRAVPTRAGATLLYGGRRVERAG